MSAPEPVAEPGAPAWPGGLVFTDEVLPELEIRELVPLFLLEGNFSIFSTQEVTTYLEALFLPRDGDAATVRARAFAALHAALLNPPPSTAEIRGTIPVLRNPRKDLNEEEPGEVINSIAVARSAPTFAQRQRALDGVFFPLETDTETLELDPEADVLYKPTRPEGVTAGIASQADVSQATRLFPLDSDYPLILESLQFQRPVYSQHHTLSEKAGAMRKGHAGIVPLPETPEAAFALALDDLAKTVEESGTADAHTLKAAMDLYGLNLDTLSEKDTEALLDRVKKAFRAADRRPAAEDADAGSRRSAAPKGKKVLTATETGRALILGLQEYLKRPATFQDRLGLYETYLQNPPPMPALSDIPETLTGLAEALSRREIELRDVVEYLRIMRLRRIYDFIRSQIETYSKANPESLQAAQKVAATLRVAWDRLVAPSIAYSSLRFPVAADMEEIQAGRDTSNYDGNPTDDPELGGMVPDAAAVVAASEAAETLGTTAFADEADDALWEMAETQETTETSTPAGLGIVGMPPGSDEVARILLPVFQRLSRATGLPVNYVALVELWRARVLRRATTEVWSETTTAAAAPAAAAAPLDFLDITSVQEYIAVHWPAEEHTRLRARAREISQELTAAVRDAFVIGVSYWLITVQQAAVARALVFDPLAGNVRYLDKWSPFGPPLSGTTAGAAAMGEPGALTYMAYIILDTPLSGTVAGVENALRFADIASLYSAVLRESRNAFPDECAALATHWATYRAETEQVTERVKAAEVSLAEAIQLKQRHRVLREYVKVLLYLPGLLSGKGPRAVGPGAAAAGCCLQKLNADYKADMDWRTQNKRLAQLKDTFAKKRMTRVDRPALALPRGAVAPAEAPPTAPVVVPAPEVAAPEVAAPEVAAPEPVVIAWLNSLATRPPLTLLPQGLLAGIRNDSRILAPMTERALTLAIRTSQKRMPGFPEKLVAQVGTDELTGLLTLVATTLAHRRTSYAPESPEAVALTEAMAAIRTFKTEWSHLDSIVDERDLPDLRRIAQYVLARAICSPADPSAGGAAARTLSLPQAVQAAFLPAMVKETLTVIAAALAAREMPTVEDQQAFITQKREEQKTQILSELDVLTVEERELVLQSRRLGFGSVGALGGALRGTEAPAAPGEEGPATALAAAPVAEHDAWAEALDFQAGMGQNPDDMNEDAI